MPAQPDFRCSCTVFRMVDTFRQFALMDLMTGGGPGTRTTVLNYYTYTGPHPMLFYGPYGFFPIPTAIGLAFLVMAYLRRDKR